MLSEKLRARAERFRPAKLRPLVYNPQVRPHWIGGTDRFWYRHESPGGIDFLVVDAATGAKSPAFDQRLLAAALGQDAARLRLDGLRLEADGAVHFTVDGTAWRWTAADGLQPGEAPPAPRPGETLSPDGKLAAFRRGDDLWLREVGTGVERPLTTDGVPHHAYAKSPDMNLTTVTLQQRGIALPAVVLWAADSRRLLTSRLDERAVLPLPLVQHVPGGGAVRPVLHSMRVALSGDAELPMEQLWLFDTDGGRATPGPVLVAGVMTCIEREEAWWSADGGRVFFIDRDRCSRGMALMEMDVASGAARLVIAETSDSFVEVNLSVTGLPNIRVLDGSDEVIWFSQRDGHAHLYLYDLRSGALKNRITGGDWVVRDLLHVDEAARKILFLAGGVDPTADPYFRVLCSVGLDGTGFAVLTPEPGDHAVAAPQKRVPRDHIRPVGEVGAFLAPSGQYFVHTHSTLERAPVSVLRRIDGSLVAGLEEAVLDPSLAAAWRWPQCLRLRAADNSTELFGAMWLPTDFDPSRKYPVIDYIYPGPQRGITPTVMLTDVMADLFRSCLPQMFAELGFAVVNIDGRGTPLRGKAFHDASYGRLDDPGMLADHVAGLRQLAALHGFIDLGRVGIMGHSGGGYASVRAMLEYPETFHAAVATSGNHDQRGYSYSWCEKYMGPLVRQLDGSSNYDSAANPPLAARLQGKLLLAYGEMDDNVHPALTLQLVAALIAADKDFDLMVLPNDDHTTVWNNAWFLRRAMEFMATHLGAAPPG